MIEENTKAILVPKEEEACEILAQIKIKGLTRELTRKMGRYCVNVYEDDFENMYGAGMLGEIAGNSESDCFVLKSLEQYTDEMGLKLDIEHGEAILF